MSAPGLVLRGMIITLALLLALSPPAILAERLTPVEVRVIAPTTAFPGDKVNIFIEARFNGTLVDDVTLVPHVWQQDGTAIKFTRLPAPNRFATGHFNTTYTVPANATGTHWVHVPGAARGFANTGTANIQITPKGLSVIVDAGRVLVPGEASQIYAIITLGGVLVDPEFPVQHFHTPDGRTIDLTAPKRIHVGFFVWNWTVPSVPGSYGIHIRPRVGTLTAEGHVAVEATPRLASTDVIRGVQSGVEGKLSALDGQFTGIRSAVDAFRSRVEAIEGSLAGFTNLGYAVIGLAVIIVILQAVILARKR